MVRPQSCPICRSPLPPGATADSPLFPFCGERCRNVDLLRWSTGRYAIVEPLVSDEDAEAVPTDEPPFDDEPASDRW